MSSAKNRSRCGACGQRAVLALAVLALAPAVTAFAAGGPGHPRPQTVEALEGAVQTANAPLVARIAGGSSDVHGGEPLAFEFESGVDGYLNVVHVDAEGKVSVLYPNRSGDDGRLRAGQVKRFPEQGALTAELPYGPESLFAFRTEEPLQLDALGVGRDEDYAVVDPDTAPAFAECLGSHLRARSKGGLAAARVDYRVKPPEDKPYTQRDVETYFGTRTRSIGRKSMNLLIHFDSGSAELTDEARANLDEVGRALRVGGLKNMPFQLSGHTDDVGDEGTNLALSERRARAAHSYLVEKYGIEPARLKAIGYGEQKPKVSSGAPEARNENRRVELELANLTRSVSAYQCGPAN